MELATAAMRQEMAQSLPYSPLNRLIDLYYASGKHNGKNATDIRISFVGAYATTDPGFLSDTTYELFIIIQGVVQRVTNREGILEGQLNTRHSICGLEGTISQTHIGFKTSIEREENKRATYLRSDMDTVLDLITDLNNMNFDGYSAESDSVFIGEYHSSNWRVALMGKKELLIIPRREVWDPSANPVDPDIVLHQLTESLFNTDR